MVDVLQVRGQYHEKCNAQFCTLNVSPRIQISILAECASRNIDTTQSKITSIHLETMLKSATDNINKNVKKLFQIHIWAKNCQDSKMIVYLVVIC
jgi:hypothetical protein